MNTHFNTIGRKNLKFSGFYDDRETAAKPADYEEGIAVDMTEFVDPNAGVEYEKEEPKATAAEGVYYVTDECKKEEGWDLCKKEDAEMIKYTGVEYKYDAEDKFDGVKADSKEDAVSALVKSLSEYIASMADMFKSTPFQELTAQLDKEDREASKADGTYENYLEIFGVKSYSVTKSSMYIQLTEDVDVYFNDKRVEGSSFDIPVDGSLHIFLSGEDFDTDMDMYFDNKACIYSAGVVQGFGLYKSHAMNIYNVPEVATIPAAPSMPMSSAEFKQMKFDFDGDATKIATAGYVQVANPMIYSYSGNPGSSLDVKVSDEYINQVKVSLADYMDTAKSSLGIGLQTLSSIGNNVQSAAQQSFVNNSSDFASIGYAQDKLMGLAGLVKNEEVVGNAVEATAACGACNCPDCTGDYDTPKAALSNFGSTQGLIYEAPSVFAANPLAVVKVAL